MINKEILKKKIISELKGKERELVEYLILTRIPSRPYVITGYRALKRVIGEDYTVYDIRELFYQLKHKNILTDFQILFSDNEDKVKMHNIEFVARLNQTYLLSVE